MVLQKEKVKQVFPKVDEVDVNVIFYKTLRRRVEKTHYHMHITISALTSKSMAIKLTTIIIGNLK